MQKMQNNAFFSIENWQVRVELRSTLCSHSKKKKKKKAPEQRYHTVTETPIERYAQRENGVSYKINRVVKEKD